MAKRDSHCSYCGAAFAEDAQGWPRTCAACGSMTYKNPLPVSVALVPVEGGGLLTVRRAIEPGKGMLALPGGYIGLGESWQEAGAREVQEETGVHIAPAGIRLFDVQSAPDATVLIFGLAPPIAPDAVLPLAPNAETAELVILRGPQEMAFSLHTAAAGRFWQEQGSGG
jgi:ADP-ribose pyrophosphatase YjhB (NUDIX family)